MSRVCRLKQKNNGTETVTNNGGSNQKASQTKQSKSSSTVLSKLSRSFVDDFQHFMIPQLIKVRFMKGLCLSRH